MPRPPDPHPASRSSVGSPHHLGTGQNKEQCCPGKDNLATLTDRHTHVHTHTQHIIFPASQWTTNLPDQPGSPQILYTQLTPFFRQRCMSICDPEVAWVFSGSPPL